MADTPFEIEYYLNGESISQRLQDKLESRLSKLANGHHDITGASLAISKPSEKHEIYQARLVLYHKPEQIVGIAKSDTVAHALSESLEAVQRQVRKHREHLRDRRRQADPTPSQLAPDMMPDVPDEEDEE